MKEKADTSGTHSGAADARDGDGQTEGVRIRAQSSADQAKVRRCAEGKSGIIIAKDSNQIR